ncbi:MAG: transposase [Deltaproteobacteria bacterium]|nr:transposase [Deltaproteobacteria bacterium]
MRFSTLSNDEVNIPPLIPGRRRRLTNDQKRHILVQGFAQYKSISEIGRRYDIPVTLLFRWKKELRISLHDPAIHLIEPEARIEALESRLAELERLNSALSQKLQQVLEARPHH